MARDLIGKSGIQLPWGRGHVSASAAKIRRATRGTRLDLPHHTASRQKLKIIVARLLNTCSVPGILHDNIADARPSTAAGPIAWWSRAWPWWSRKRQRWRRPPRASSRRRESAKHQPGHRGCSCLHRPQSRPTDWPSSPRHRIRSFDAWQSSQRNQSATRRR